jgi:peroxiredoxin
MIRKIATLLCAAALLAAVPAMAGKVPVGAPAPDFTLTDIDGKTFQLSTFKDKKPVVITIMQSACSSCKDEMKLLNELKSDNYEMIAVNVDARGGAPGWADNVKNYLKELEVSIRVASDPKFSVGRMFGVGATPCTIVIGKDGKLVAQIVGFTAGEDDVEIKKVLGGLK